LFIGIATPFFVDQDVYTHIADGFYRPHRNYAYIKSRKHKDEATNTGEIDDYIKDVVGSFIIFTFTIGPLLYKKHKNDFSQPEI
jgi:hypothetical protein